MNVYDFDGTIYAGDSTVDFFLFALKCNPSLICYVPRQAWGFLLYGLKRISKTELKEYFFSFLSGLDAEKLAEDFWNQNQHRIYKWYLDQQQPDDIIISASPKFLLQPICNRLGIHHLIASKVDPETGMFAGENCRGQEKVRRLESEYNVNHIDSFYSDSLSDRPLAGIADKAFLVDKGIVREWKGLYNHEQR
jgi:HAD superfamily phosphoserine phosphatase-like hydrolase